jgi:predicted metalloprotease
MEHSRRSANVEDRRGMRRPMAIGGGIGAVVIALLIALMGGDPTEVLGGAARSPAVQEQRPPSPEEDRLAEFVHRVLGDTEETWEKLFREQGATYRHPKLVLFTDAVDSACGSASAAMGPFYCPADGQVYIDLSFYDDLRSRFRAPGDFAQAYVIAHEVGHHIQNLLGISDKVHAMRGRVSETEFNQLSVRLELQADYLAGVWAHHAEQARDILETGDVEEALNAASAIGDDRLQAQARGRVVPDSFTHGTSAQRVRWFKLGLERGDFRDLTRGGTGDTFAARNL